VTYARVLLLFAVAPIAALAVALRGRVRRAHLTSLGAILAIVYAATSPWDNVAVHRGYWSFDRARTWGVFVAYLPLEEYLFFGLQTVLAALVLVALIDPSSRRRP
jgi:lycopene cyclase domain-containing protein